MVQAIYYPYGGILSQSTNQGFQKFKYNGKEFDTMHGLNMYDYGARQQDPAVGMFTSMDPLCEKYYNISPYMYCAGNQIRYVDPDGRALGDFYDENGNYLGNDGKDDDMKYVIKTTTDNFNEDGDQVPGAGLSKADKKTTIKFIKKNSGNTQAFAENNLAYENSVAFESSLANRQKMVEIVSNDDGKGGTKDCNNREYGGYIDNGVCNSVKPGEIAKPSEGPAMIDLPNGYVTFHGHPSGKIVERKFVMLDSGNSGYVTTTSFWPQHPSSIDINNAGNFTCYVFGMRDGITYIYNSKGVQATIPTKVFINVK